MELLQSSRVAVSENQHMAVKVVDVFFLLPELENLKYCGEIL